jgi:tRNA (mo5U34)-methyltransferase
MNTDLKEKVAQSSYWYHKIKLPGITTPGWAPIAPEMYDVPSDLSGQRILDIGAWDGYWTFEAIKRGAEYVMAIDNFSDPGDAYNDTTPRDGWNNFDLCKQALGYTDTQCTRHETDLYNMTPEQNGTFDSVFCFGVLYHMRYPLLALDKIFALIKPGGTLYLETALLDHFSPYRGGIGKGYNEDDVVMEFYPNNEYANVTSNWWVPTSDCLGHMINAAGFRNTVVWPLTSNPDVSATCRGFAQAVKL